MSEFLFPTEVISLPSEGKYYPVGHPLRDNGGKLEIKYMTAKEEDILTSANLINNDVVFDKFLESLIVHEGVNYFDLTTGDISAIFIASRVLAYGKNYAADVTCGHCDHNAEYMIDLTELESPDDLIDGDENGHYEFGTDTGLTITIKPLTRGDEVQLAKDQKATNLVNSNITSNRMTSRLKKIVVAVDGKTDRGELHTIIENLVVRDTNKIREEANNINPSIDTTMELSCVSCDQVIKGGIPIGADFFWPNL